MRILICMLELIISVASQARIRGTCPELSNDRHRLVPIARNFKSGIGNKTAYRKSWLKLAIEYKTSNTLTDECKASVSIRSTVFPRFEIPIPSGRVLW